MRYYYDPELDTFNETSEVNENGEIIIPEKAIELDTMIAQMFVRAEAMGQKIDRSRIDEFKIDHEKIAAKWKEHRRSVRDILLAETDWTQLPDAFGGDDGYKKAWAIYRQELRDLDLTGENWPVRPEKPAEPDPETVPEVKPGFFRRSINFITGKA